MELISEAVSFAAKAHDGMRRKQSNTPYIIHPLEAAVIVSTMTDDQHIISAAALHDVVEDTMVTLDEIEEKFAVVTCDNSEYEAAKDFLIGVRKGTSSFEALIERNNLGKLKDPGVRTLNFENLLTFFIWQHRKEVVDNDR